MQQTHRTDVPARRARAPVRRTVCFSLDEETLRLARECADNRLMSLAAWLAKATLHHLEFEEALRDTDEIFAELGIEPDEEEDRRIDEELDAAGFVKLIPYNPSGPRRTVSTKLDQGIVDRVLGIARYLGMSPAAWLARETWYHTQIDPRHLADEQDAAGSELNLLEVAL